MKVSFTYIFTCLLVVTLFSSCEKEDPSPQAKLEGTWEMTNFVAVNPVSMQEIDFVFEIEKLFPCISENLITFKDGIYITSLPGNCVSEDGQSLQFFPSATTGTYTITDDGKFSLDDDDNFTYEGTYRFDGNKKFIFVTGEGAETLTITYNKK